MLAAVIIPAPSVYAASSLGGCDVSGYAYMTTTPEHYWFSPGSYATITPPSEHSISTLSDGTFGNSLSLDAGDSEFYIKTENSSPSRISTDGILLWDYTAPVGEITLDNEVKSNELKSTVVFEKFYVNSVSFSITASDMDSGVKSIEYYISASDSALSIGELETVSWSDYNGSGTVTEPAASFPVAPQKYIVYARITDNVGNTTYISTDGFTVQNWGTPVVHNGNKYYIYPDGTTSARVNGNGIIWLKATDHDGRSLWYGLDNSNGYIEENSRFMIIPVSKSHPLFATIDQKHANLIEDDNYNLFFFNLFKPDETPHGDIPGGYKLYIQYPDGWDSGDCRTAMLPFGEDMDTVVSIAQLSGPEGSGKFAVMEAFYQAQYFMYDKKDAGSQTNPGGSGIVVPEDKNSPADKSTQTGDNFTPVYWIAIALAALITGYCSVRRRV